jgi:hypothetical protein
MKIHIVLDGDDQAAAQRFLMRLAEEALRAARRLDQARDGR